MIEICLLFSCNHRPFYSFFIISSLLLLNLRLVFWQFFDYFTVDEQKISEMWNGHIDEHDI